MSVQGLSIKEAASVIGVSPKTVRRFIKDGKVPAELCAGKYGNEYRILNIPPGLVTNKPLDKDIAIGIVNDPTQGLDMVRELQERNLQLAGQLGAAQERIRSLENQVKLLIAPGQPWWRRLFKVRIGD